MNRQSRHEETEHKKERKKNAVEKRNKNTLTSEDGVCMHDVNSESTNTNTERRVCSHETKNRIVHDQGN